MPDIGEGVLSTVVWPSYVGVALAGVTPPFSIDEPINSGYQRGQILWTPVNDDRQVVGRATILVPAGEYTHFVYFRHPSRPQACGVARMEHPLRLSAVLTSLVVDPIVNGDMQLMKGV